MSKIEQLKEMIYNSRSISVVIHYDNKSNIVGEPYNNAVVRIEGDLLIIEDAGKKAQLTGDSIKKIEDKNVELLFSDEDERAIYVGLLIR